MLLASKRPLLINRDSILQHLWEAPDLYHAQDEDEGNALASLEAALTQIRIDWEQGTLRLPVDTCARLSWTVGAREMIRVWEEACH